jgi:pimeloyl-ACP methyl ester carboxylesterase
MPGFGQSDLPESGFTLDAVAEGVLAFLDQRGVRRFTLAAHSLGCFVAARVAAIEPTHVERVIMVDGTLLRVSALLRRPLNAFGQPRLAIAVALQFLFGMAPLPKVAVGLLAQSRGLRRLFLWPFMAHPGDVDGKLIADVLSNTGGFVVLRSLLRARTTDIRTLLLGIEQEVDVVWGSLSRLVSEEDVQLATQYLSIARRFRMADCGHWPLVEAPGELARFILQR